MICGSVDDRIEEKLRLDPRPFAYLARSATHSRHIAADAIARNRHAACLRAELLRVLRHILEHGIAFLGREHVA